MAKNEVKLIYREKTKDWLFPDGTTNHILDLNKIMEQNPDKLLDFRTEKAEKVTVRPNLALDEYIRRYLRPEKHSVKVRSLSDDELVDIAPRNRGRPRKVNVAQEESKDLVPSTPNTDLARALESRPRPRVTIKRKV